MKVGDRVRVTWRYDRSYGPGVAEHKGVITKLDDWISIQGDSRLDIKLTMIDKIDSL